MGSFRLGFVTRTILFEIFTTILVGCAIVLALNVFGVRISLNFEAYLNALVNLNAGIIIAIFIAVFHSSNEKMESFRELKKATRQQYAIFLINSVVVCLATLFVNNTSNTAVENWFAQLPLNIIVSVIATGATVTNLYYVYKMLNVAFSK